MRHPCGLSTGARVLGNTVVGDMIRVIIITILIYLFAAPHIEILRLRDNLRIADSINAMMVPVKRRPAVNIAKQKGKRHGSSGWL